jgi:hypothetical protein
MITKEDIVRALRENSIQQTFLTEFRVKDSGRAVGYEAAKTYYEVSELKMCAVGKIRYKLGVGWYDINAALIPYGRGVHKIMYMNDVQHYSFEQIAGIIESWEAK